jgi:glycine C-acetyltransferase
MIGDAARAGQMAELLLDHGVYAIGFSYPVVPQGKARVRVQVSAAHSHHDLVKAVDAFTKVRAKMGLSKASTA